MTATRPPGRDGRIDRLRGAAVVAMVADHAAAFALHLGLHGSTAEVLDAVRRWPTRLSMPTFMVVSGLLLAHHVPSRRRRAQVAAVAVAVNAALVLCAPGIDVPEILAVWSLLMCAGEVLRTWPVPAASAGILWATTWPVAWAGYQPGVVAAYLCLGVLAARTGAGLGTVGGWLPLWLEPVGRRPLTIYAAHLAAICVAAVAVGVAS